MLQNIGLAVMICSSGLRFAACLYFEVADRPREVEIPLTRKKPLVASTKPPAFVIRVDSISLGLWSKDKGMATPSRQTTALLSPAFAHHNVFSWLLLRQKYTRPAKDDPGASIGAAAPSEVLHRHFHWRALDAAIICWNSAKASFTETFSPSSSSSCGGAFYELAGAGLRRSSGLEFGLVLRQP